MTAASSPLDLHGPCRVAGNDDGLAVGDEAVDGAVADVGAGWCGAAAAERLRRPRQMRAVVGAGSVERRGQAGDEQLHLGQRMGLVARPTALEWAARRDADCAAVDKPVDGLISIEKPAPVHRRPPVRAQPVAHARGRPL